MTLSAGQTFNEEPLILPGLDFSQYSVKVISEEATVFIINALEFR
jgi:hypothetical protein